MSQATHKRMTTRGWWVGHPFIGGVLVRAVTRGRAQAIGSVECDQDFTGVKSIRVPALDGTGPEGYVDWDEGKCFGAVRACERCGYEFAVTARRQGARLCDECELMLQELGQEVKVA